MILSNVVSMTNRVTSVISSRHAYHYSCIISTKYCRLVKLSFALLSPITGTKWPTLLCSQTQLRSIFRSVSASRLKPKQRVWLGSGWHQCPSFHAWVPQLEDKNQRAPAQRTWRRHEIRGPSSHECGGHILGSAATIFVPYTHARVSPVMRFCSRCTEVKLSK